MPDAARYTFRCAEDAHAQITHLFDFVSPTAIALWNLRWQVQGFLTQMPDANWKDLAGRFASGSGMRGGELKRACVLTPWEGQLSQFAEFVLVNVISTFEDYTSRLAEFVPKKNQRNVSKALQFPGGASKFPKINGRDWAFAQISQPSVALKNVFSDATRANKRFSGKNIENLLICYRFFKSMRNMIAHNGGRADAETEYAYNRFSAVATTTDLGISEVPKHHPIVLGQGIKLDLRGVTGLSNIILRIITTYDSDLSETTIGEKELLSRVSPVPKARQLVKPKDRDRHIANVIHFAGMPNPKLTDAFERFLKTHKVIPHFW